jgi:hypothetical protein
MQEYIRPFMPLCMTAFKDGYIAKKADTIAETNKYLKGYAENHAPGLPADVAREILEIHMVYMMD